MIKKTMMTAVMGLGLALCVSPAFGDSLAANFSNTTGQALGNGPFTLGWQFTITSAIDVTALDIFDSGQDGLAESHQVGIWNSTGTLLVSGTVAAGTVDPLNDKFRTVSVASTLLGPGTYNIGAVFIDGGDPNLFPGDATAFATASGITFDSDQFLVGSSLSDPTSTGSTDPSYFGPDFEFHSAAVPEPGSLVLLASVLSLTGLGLRRRFAKQNQ